MIGRHEPYLGGDKMSRSKVTAITAVLAFVGLAGCQTASNLLSGGNTDTDETVGVAIEDNTPPDEVAVVPVAPAAKVASAPALPAYTPPTYQQPIYGQPAQQPVYQTGQIPVYGQPNQAGQGALAGIQQQQQIPQQGFQSPGGGVPVFPQQQQFQQQPAYPQQQQGYPQQQGFQQQQPAFPQQQGYQDQGYQQQAYQNQGYQQQQGYQEQGYQQQNYYPQQPMDLMPYPGPDGAHSHGSDGNYADQQQSYGSQQFDPALIERGEYLVQIGSCTDCHTDGALVGEPEPNRYLAGTHIGINVAGLGVMYAPNLTPDAETGLGNWSVGDIVRALRTGVRPDGSPLRPPMPIANISRMNEEDATAVAVYLKSLRPVRHVTNRNPVPVSSANYPYMDKVTPDMN